MRFSALLGFAILLPVLSGCGLSQDHWKSSLADQSDLEICAASMDYRTGIPWDIKKHAASDLIESKKIKCDKKKAYQLMLTQVPDPSEYYNHVCIPSTINGIYGCW